MSQHDVCQQVVRPPVRFGAGDSLPPLQELLRPAPSAVQGTLARGITQLSMTHYTVPALNWIKSGLIQTIIALDVFGIWIPRISVSLTRDAMPYNPLKDPDLKDRPPAQAWAVAQWRKLKALNWPNFLEETNREFASGPGLYTMCVLGYLAAQRHLFKAGDVVGLPHERFKSVLGEVHQYLDKHEVSPEAAVRDPNGLANLLHHRFQVASQPRAMQVLSPKLTAWSEMAQAVSKSELALSTLRHSRLADVTLQQKTSAIIETLTHQRQALGALEHGITQQLRQLNERHLPAESLFNKGLWRLPEFDPHGTLQGQKVGSVQALFKERAAVGQLWAHLSERLNQGGVTREGLAQLFETTYRRSLNQKAAYLGGLATLSVGWLFFLAWLSQHNRRYPANRLLRVEGPNLPVTPSAISSQPGSVGGGAVSGPGFVSGGLQ